MNVKKRRFDRLAALLLVIIMVAAALSACGVPDTGPGTPGTQQPGTPGTQQPGTPGTQQPGTPDTQQPEVPTDDRVRGGVYVMSVNVAPSTLFTIYRVAGFGSIIQPAVETLGRRCVVDPTRMLPHLAKSIDFDRENYRVTVVLNEGIMFHDGSELTAEVVQWNMEFAMQNRLGGAFHNPIGFERPDRYTLIVQFDNFFIDSDIVIGMRPIYSMQAYLDHGAEWMNFHPVGTGPFVFEEYVIDTRIRYVRNDNYWQEGKPFLDGVDVMIIFDPMAAMTAFVNGELHSLNTNDRAINEALLGMGFEDRSLPAFTGWHNNIIAPSSWHPDDPFSNVYVRRAVFRYGLDYDELAMLALGRFANNNRHLSIPGSLIYDEAINEGFFFDLDKARQMLADAGYPDGFEFNIYTIFNTVPLATAMQDALRRLNITANVIEIQGTDPRRTDGTMRGLTIHGGGIVWDIIPNPIGTMYHPRTPTHGAHISFSEEYERLFDLARTARCFEERAYYGRQLLWYAIYDQVLFVNAHWQMPGLYIHDFVMDSALETRGTVTYESMWLNR